RAGLKLMLIFPYAFVDTSEAWFEPRRRRLAISGAGPASDLVVGGSFALVAAFLASGNLRDVVFQLALAGYLGAFFNLNPFLERDGYHMLVDLTREPNLRRRSRQQLARRLGRRAAGRDEPRILAVYGVAGLCWSVVAVGFAVLLSTRYYPRLVEVAPRWAVWTLLGICYALMLVPVLVTIGRPLRERWSSPAEGHRAT